MSYSGDRFNVYAIALLGSESDARGSASRYRLRVKQVGTLVAFKFILLFVLALNTRFVMDEFWQLGQAKYLFNGYFNTIWPAKSAGYALFYKLALSLGWDSVSSVLIGRVQTTLLGCATVAMVYMIAREMGHDRLRALIEVLVLVCFSNFEERIFRTRAEPLALFFAIAALLVVVRGKTDHWQRLFAAGLLSGFAFLSTQKSIYFNGALGLALVTDAIVIRRPSLALTRGLKLVAGWALAIAAYCVAFGGSEPLPILKNLLFGPVNVATHGGDPYENLHIYAWQSLLKNFLLYAICILGIAVALMRYKTLHAAERMVLVFAIVMALLVFTHNQPWPYVFIMVQPVLAVWSLQILGLWKFNVRATRLFWTAFVTAVAISFVSNLLYLRLDNRAQLQTLARAETMLSPTDRYFDGTGMLPTRRESTLSWLDRGTVLATLDQGRASSVYKGLRDSPPKIIIWSYRMDAILPLIQPLLVSRYTRVAPNILLLGIRLRRGETSDFIVTIPGRYRLYTLKGKPLDAAIVIDGEARNSPLDLSVGLRTLQLNGGADQAILAPEGNYSGVFVPDQPHLRLFDDVYD